ncbi:MAG TPA: cob(I)yrinic acid a,c-diamide adenosyltransferase [Myxococcota bacterium]|nr:cob(I)yrinic acid a,c-diamide adenosyltransferase [Myxococcota bacterium]
MKIYTRGGDTGETSLFGGERVKKSAPRVAAYGEVDELNSVVGVARAELGHDDLRAKLETIQSSLFDLGGELATPGAARERKGPRVADADVAELEAWIDALETELEPLRNFILPGGSRAASFLHLARTVCRRAERAVISLAECEEIDALLVRYLNRLSDLLFVMARAVNRRAGMAEPQWVGRER